MERLSATPQPGPQTPGHMFPDAGTPVYTASFPEEDMASLRLWGSYKLPTHQAHLPQQSLEPMLLWAGWGETRPAHGAHWWQGLHALPIDWERHLLSTSHVRNSPHARTAFTLNYFNSVLVN